MNYKQRHSQLERAVDAAARAESRWSLARLGAFLLAAAGWVPFQNHLPIAILLSGSGVALFIWTIVRHRSAGETHRVLKLEKLVIFETLQRLGGYLVTIRSTTRPADSRIASLSSLISPGQTWELTEQERDDLDLYATPIGIFGLLNRTSTGIGAQRLREWAENPCLDPAAIEARQSAIRWLSGNSATHVGLLAQLAALRRLDASMASFAEALVDAQLLLRPAISWLAWAWSFIGLALVLLGLSRIVEQDLRGLFVILAVVAFNGVATLPVRTRLRRSLRQWEQAADFAEEYARVATGAVRDLPPSNDQVETLPEALSILRDAFVPVCDARSLPAALRYINWVSGGGMVRVALNFTALYDLHVIEAINHRLIPRRETLRHGLAALADLEALLSLACFAAEQPDTVWPRVALSPAAPLLNIVGGRHPLIPPEHDVANDLGLSAQQNIWLITGSNMSGKSTFLRMAGVNVMLAQIGSATLTDAMELTPLRLITDLRIRDSLGKAESYFLAEVRQLRRMLVPPEGGSPVFGLVDEPFRGTNHQEQRAATLAIIEHLGASRGLYLIATHDRTVARQCGGNGIANWHFQEELGESELLFDYRIRDGIAETRNALRVLEREGYPASLMARAHAWVDGKTEENDAPKAVE